MFVFWRPDQSSVCGKDVCTYLGHHHNNHVCVEDACPINGRPKIYIVHLYRRI